MAPRPKKPPRDEHLGDIRSQIRLLLWLLGPLTVLAILLNLVGAGRIATVLLGGCVFSWAVFAVYLLFHFTLINPAGNAFGRIFLPSGKSTPPAKGLSHIEAMAVRGDLARAVEAYKAEIATDPADVTSCERLGTLAMRQLADYDLAVWAYREAERRAESPARKFGFALIVVGICRDQLKDRGKTVVELRRLVQLYPDAPRIEALKAELDELKAGLFDDRGA
jgi:tetratricopeptide (TPR) repeat protein